MPAWGKDILKSIPGLTRFVRVVRGQIVPNRTVWKWVGLTYAVIAGGGIGGFVWVSGNGGLRIAVFAGILGLILIGPLVWLMGTVLVKLDEQHRRTTENLSNTEVRLREMVNVRPLIDGPPLDFSGWTMSPHLGKLLAQIIARHQPDHIVECGSGTSTVFVAHALRKYNPSGQITAIEHLEKYAEKTKQLIQDHSCGNHASVLLAPLCKRDVEGEKKSWYDVTTDDLGNRQIDLLLVDGPPHETGPMARYPAVPILHSKLADDCVILVDDGDRPEERRAAKKWANRLQADLEYGEGPGGSYILRC